MASFINLFDTYYPTIYLFYRKIIWFIFPNNLNKTLKFFLPYMQACLISEEKYDISRKYTTLHLLLSPNSPKEILW